MHIFTLGGIFLNLKCSYSLLSVASAVWQQSWASAPLLEFSLRWLVLFLSQCFCDWRVLNKDSFKISRAGTYANTSCLEREVSSKIHLQESFTSIICSIINLLPLQVQSSAAWRYCLLCLKSHETWAFQIFNRGTGAASPQFSLSANPF